MLRLRAHGIVQRRWALNKFCLSALTPSSIHISEDLAGLWTSYPPTEVCIHSYTLYDSYGTPLDFDVKDINVPINRGRLGDNRTHHITSNYMSRMRHTECNSLFKT